MLEMLMDIIFSHWQMGDCIVTAYDLTRVFDLLICQYELQLSTNTVINFIFSFDHYPHGFNHTADAKYGLY